MRPPVRFRPNTELLSVNPFRSMQDHSSELSSDISYDLDSEAQSAVPGHRPDPAAEIPPTRPDDAVPDRPGRSPEAPLPARRLSAPYRGPEAAPIAEPATRGEATPPFTVIDEDGDTRINDGALGALLEGVYANPFHRGTPAAIHTDWDRLALEDALLPAGPTHGLGRLMVDRLRAEGVDPADLNPDHPALADENVPDDGPPEGDALTARAAEGAGAAPNSGPLEPNAGPGTGNTAETLGPDSDGGSGDGGGGGGDDGHEWTDWAAPLYGSDADRARILDGLTTLADLEPEAAEALIDDLLPGRYEAKAELMRRLRKPPAERNAAEQQNAISAVAKVGHLIQRDREIDGLLAENRQVFAILERESDVTVTLRVEAPTSANSAEAFGSAEAGPDQAGYAQADADHTESPQTAEPVQNHVFSFPDPNASPHTPDSKLSIYLPADVALRIGRDPANAERGLGRMMALERLASDLEALDRWIQENETIVLRQGRGARSRPGAGRKTGISDAGKAMRAAARPMADAQLRYDFARALVEADDTPAHRALLMAARDQRDAVMRVLAPTLFPASYDYESLLKTITEWAPVTGQIMALRDAGESAAAAWESAEQGDVAGTALHLGLVLLDGIGVVPGVGTAIRKAGRVAIDILPENAAQAVNRVHSQYQLARAANRSDPTRRAQQPTVSVEDMFGSAYNSLPAEMQTRIRGIYPNILGQAGELTGNDKLRAGGFEVNVRETSKSTRKNPKTTTQARRKTKDGVRIYDAETMQGIERASLILFIPLLRPSRTKTKGALWDMKVGPGNKSKAAEAKDKLVKEDSTKARNATETGGTASNKEKPEGTDNDPNTTDQKDTRADIEADSKNEKILEAETPKDAVDIQYLTWKTSELDPEHLRNITKRLVYRKIGSGDAKGLSKQQADALVEAVEVWHARQVARSNRPILIADLVIYTASVIERQSRAESDHGEARDGGR